MPIQFGTLTLYNVDELSQKFGLHPVTLRRLFRKGKLQGRKVGKRWYLTEESLRAYFKGAGSPRRARPTP